MLIRKARERREGKMFSPRDILAVMVKARGNIWECDQSLYWRTWHSLTWLAVMSHDRPPSEQQICALNKIGQFIDINNIMPWLDVCFYTDTLYGIELGSSLWGRTTILDKINRTSGAPLPSFQWCQNGALLLLRAFIIALGGWGIIVPFYTVQDCLRRTLALQEAMFAMQITSDLLSHAR